MAIVAPLFVVCEVGQYLDVQVTIPGDTTGWDVRATLRTAAKSVAAITTKTVGSGIVNTPGASSSTLTISFTASDTGSLTPGAYTWEVERVDSGEIFPIVDTSCFLLTPADGSAYPQLTNLSTYRAWRGESETVTDAEAKFELLALAAAEAAIRSLCGRQFNQGTYTEYIDANWTQTFMVRETPLYTTDIDIRLDHNRAFGAETELTYGTDFDLQITTNGYSENGIVYRRNGFWQGAVERPRGSLAARRVPAVGVIKAMYQGGMALIPADLQVAIFETVAQKLASRTHGVPLQSESGMNYSYSLGNLEAEAQRLMSVQSVISRYRRGDIWVG